MLARCRRILRLCVAVAGVLSFVFVLIPVPVAMADTIEVSGPVVTDTVWSTGNVYVVVGDVSVVPTATLTIEPGVVVKFKDDRSLLVDGTLSAAGTTAQKIYFTYWADDTVGGDTNNDGNGSAPNPNDPALVWGRIRFSASSSQSSLLDNAVIRYGGNISDTVYAALEIEDAAPTVQNSQISLNHHIGVSLISNEAANPAAPILLNNTISSNRAYALSSDVHSQPILTANVLTNNAGNGMEIRGGTIEVNRAWDQSAVVHILSGDVTVAAGRHLTLAPGLIVKARDDRSLLVDGKLTAVGTASQRIYFTFWADDTVGGDTNNDGNATSPNPNDVGLIWGRIRFGDSSDDSSLIENAVVRYGGNSSCCETSSAAIEIVDASPTLRNNQITMNRRYAVSMQTSVATIPSAPVISNNTISSNLSYAFHSDVHSAPLFNGNTLINNGGNGMEIEGGTLQAPQTWSQSSVVHIVTGDITIPSATLLTVNPGVIVKLQDNRSLFVNGKLSAVGTEAQKVVFTHWADDTIGGDTNNDGTATSPNPNDDALVWGRIRFGDSSDDSSLIQHAILRYGGDDDGHVAAVEIVDASPTIRNSQISLNRRYGVSTTTTIATIPTAPLITDNVFSSNVSYALSSDLNSHIVLAGNTLLNNGGNGMEVRGGTLQVDKVWDQPSVVYILTGDVTVAPAVTLTIAPGVITKWQDDRSLLVDGKLSAEGSTAQRIYFTFWADDAIGGDTNNDGGATTPNPNDNARVWGRIRFSNSSDDSSVIENAIIRYAGNTNCCEVNNAALELVDASPTIRTTQITLNRSHGISTQSTSPAFPADPTLTCLDVEDNTGFGLFNLTPSSAIDARDLWWGSTTGPRHAGANPGGLGDELSSGVIFIPWLESRCTSNQPVDRYMYLPLIRR